MQADLQRQSSATEANAPCGSALEWTQRLVAYDTTSRHSNLGLIESVRDHFLAKGLRPQLSYNLQRDKANLFVTVPAASGETNGGIVLSGHTDVVPVDGQHWTTDPFKPVVRDGKLYGRGTCDMKGFIGTSLALLPTLLDAKLREPVHYALSFDEEIGCMGAPYLLAELRERGVRPAGCIVGEPTSMRVIVAHKGINAYRCCVRGHAAHSSLTPRGVNAIEYAARLICFIRDLADEFKANGPYDQPSTCPTPPPRPAPSRAVSRSIPFRRCASSCSSSATCLASIPRRSSRASSHTRMTCCCPRCAPNTPMPTWPSTRLPRRIAGRGGTGSHHATGARAHRRPRDQQGRVRYRGRAVPACRDSGRGVRPRRYRAGAQAG